MGIYRKESGSLVRKAGKAIIDLALNINSHHAIANSVVTAKFNEIESALVGDTIGSLVTVNASNYTSPSNLYTIPYDCYITIHSLASNSQRIQMNDSTGNVIELVRGDGTYGGNVSLFMRKGMKVYFSADTFTGPTVTIREIS